MTVASKSFELPLEVVPADFTVEVGATLALAYKQRCLSLAVFSEARRRSIAPPLASIPACQSTTRARPAATKCSAIFPEGWRTIIVLWGRSLKAHAWLDYGPDPIKMLAGGGALPLAFDWKGVGVKVGKERITTRTGRCNRRDSVKNLAYMNKTWAVVIAWNHPLTSSPQGSEGSPCFDETRAQRTPANATLTTWCSPSGINNRTRKVDPSRTCSTRASKKKLSVTQCRKCCIHAHHPKICLSTLLRMLESR